MSHGFLFHPSKLAHRDLLFSLLGRCFISGEDQTSHPRLLFSFGFEYVIYCVLHLPKRISQSASLTAHPHSMQKAFKNNITLEKESTINK